MADPSDASRGNILYNDPFIMFAVHIRSSRLIALATLIFSSVLFFGVTLAVVKDVFRPLDFALTVKLQNRFPARFDDNIVLLVDAGSMEIQGILFVLAIFLFPFSKRMRIGLFLVYALGLALVLGGKGLIPQPAPPYMFQRGNQGLAFPSMHVQVESSYPSGHTYRVIFLFMTVFFATLLSPKHRIRNSMFTVATGLLSVLVMIGLVVLGKHWTTDLLGGGSLASALVAFVCLGIPQKVPSENQT